MNFILTYKMNHPKDNPDESEYFATNLKTIVLNILYSAYIIYNILILSRFKV